jgi:hypothetical protein
MDLMMKLKNYYNKKNSQNQLFLKQFLMIHHLSLQKK